MSAWYRQCQLLLADPDGEYDNITGCGNALRLSHPYVTQWVIDCLNYWRDSCHVDGFRFDLGTVLGRTPAFDQHAPLFAALAADERLSACKLIAEPWDIGLGGYQLGTSPPALANGMTSTAMPCAVSGYEGGAARYLCPAFCCFKPPV